MTVLLNQLAEYPVRIDSRSQVEIWARNGWDEWGCDGHSPGDRVSGGSGQLDPVHTRSPGCKSLREITVLIDAG